MDPASSNEEPNEIIDMDIEAHLRLSQQLRQRVISGLLPLQKTMQQSALTKEEQQAQLRNQILRALKVEYSRAQIQMCRPRESSTEQHHTLLRDMALIELEVEHLKVLNQIRQQPQTIINNVYQSEKKKSKPKNDGYQRQDWIDILDLFFRLTFGLIFVSFIGSTVTAALQYSVDGKDNCDSGPTEIRDMISEGGYSFIAFVFAGLLIVMTNVVGRYFKTKERKRIRNGIFKLGLMLTAIVSAIGMVYLSLCLGDLFQVRLGLRACGAPRATTMSRFSWALGGVGAYFFVAAGIFGLTMG